jgi:elongation factor Ts
MNITADAVKQLRERTGAGMMECKKALVETKGDLDAAADLMRKQGLAKADKKASRVAAEGVVVVEKSSDAHTAAMVEINCETDFVAREQDFRSFAQAVAARALASRPVSLEALLAAKLESGETIEERRRALIAKIGENISVRRFVVLTSTDHLGAYVHGTRIGALVAVKGGDAQLVHDLAMHVAASNPKYLSQAQVPADVVAREREILTEQAQGEGKPPEIVGGDHPHWTAVREGPRCHDRKAAEGRESGGHRLRALRSRRRHREEAGRLRSGSHGSGVGCRAQGFGSDDGQALTGAQVIDEKTPPRAGFF